jgi:hypothetical protein
VRALVEQLDSEELAQRERARDELTAKGRKILPILKPFLKSPSAEVASQIRSIVEHFEREALLEQSLPKLQTVTIPKGRHTPEEILQKIREQTGYRIDAYGIKMRETLEIGWEKAPVLRVLDEMCRRMGRGRPEPPALAVRTKNEFDTGHDWTAVTLPDQLIVDGEGKPPWATAHFNQFRAVVTDVVVTEKRSLGESSTQASLSLSVSAQPGTHPIHIGSWEVEEIQDDRGTSLKEPGPRRPVFRGEPAPDVGESLDSVWFTLDSSWRYGRQGQEPIPIKPPGPEARRIARLKAKLRVSFAVEEATRIVKVKDIKDKGKESADFGLAKIVFSQPEMKEDGFHLHYAVVGSAHGAPALTLLDPDGTEIQTGGGGSTSSATEYNRHWYLRGATEVAALRLSAWIGRKTIDLPFEFAEIPLPGAP